MTAKVTSVDQPLVPLSVQGHWIYGLPGSHLGLRRSAGAPALDSVARGLHDNETWRAWIFYGPPDQALAELSDGGPASALGADPLADWLVQMDLAVQIKRRARERLQLVNLGHSTSALEETLRRELPELEQGVRRRRSNRVSTAPSDVLRATTLALLQLRPDLLNGYLDLESWADRYGHEGDGDRWREAFDGTELLQALRRWDSHHGAIGDRDSRLVGLERQLSRDHGERDLLLANLHQLEVELDHYVEEHERLVDLVVKVEAQLARARRLLEQGRFARPAAEGP